MAPLADAPPADPRWSSRGGPPAATTSRAPAWQRMPPRLPPGFRWIAVRPGAAPPTRRGRRSLGPTPRYAVIPRWGLADRVEQAPATAQAPVQTGPSAATVRTTLFVSLLVLATAALVYTARYVLLIINRKTLLKSVVAGAADWVSVVASVAAVVALITCAVMLIRWLIARRAAAFSHYALPEQRSVRALWAGCLVPFANLLWAPVYVVELATAENHYVRLQRPIVMWWIAWIFSYALSIFAIASSWAKDAQGIANNTVVMVFAYLFAAVAVAAVGRVFEGFERKPVERPAHRWVVVGADRPDRPAARASADPVELEGQEPAA
jgi:hypothetical protein